MTGLELSWNISDFTISKWSYLFKLFQACYDVTTGHMTLRFEVFWREAANWQEENRQVWSGIIHNFAESSDFTACMWIQLCIGLSGVYRGH